MGSRNRNERWRRHGGSLVGGRDDGRLGRSRSSVGILSYHGHVVLHGRGRSSVGGGWRSVLRHAVGVHGGGVLVGRGGIVARGNTVRLWHVVGGIHGLVRDMRLVILPMVVVVVGARIVVVVVRPSATGTVALTEMALATGASIHPGDSHIGITLHWLPSRQMPGAVHHAGLGDVAAR